LSLKHVNGPVKVGALFLAFATTIALGCSSTPDTEATGGTGGQATGGAATGGAHTGGIEGTGGANTGGAATGGIAATGGKSSTGGGAGSLGGAAGGSSGTGGMTSTGGAGGSIPSGNVMPSPGCSKGSTRPSGGSITVAGDHIYTFPTAYDGKTPSPLLLGLHACSNPIDQIKKLTDGSSLETNYIRIFPKSAGDCWNYPSEVTGKVYKVFDDIVANYCVDLNRVFGTGHSSGAQLLQQIISSSEYAKHFKFRAVAPDAASAYGAVQGPLPAMYIQGIKDSNRGNGDGHEVVALYRTANMCQSTSMPYTTSVDACKSSTGAQVKAGCVIYDGCKVPTIWCSHDDSDYSGTYHGWPCFATKAMAAFFDTFK